MEWWVRGDTASLRAEIHKNKWSYTVLTKERSFPHYQFASVTRSVASEAWQNEKRARNKMGKKIHVDIAMRPANILAPHTRLVYEEVSKHFRWWKRSVKIYILFNKFHAPSQALYYVLISGGGEAKQRRQNAASTTTVNQNDHINRLSECEGFWYDVMAMNSICHSFFVTSVPNFSTANSVFHRIPKRSKLLSA